MNQLERVFFDDNIDAIEDPMKLLSSDEDSSSLTMTGNGNRRPSTPTGNAAGKMRKLSMDFLTHMRQQHHACSSHPGSFSMEG